MADLPKHPLTAEGVAAALAYLDKGGSEDVAILLAELEFKGQRDNDSDDPIARYLLAVIPDAEYVQVGGAEVYITGVVREEIGDGFINSWDVRLHATLPDSVAALVEDFDQGMYPELVEEVGTDGTACVA